MTLIIIQSFDGSASCWYFPRYLCFLCGLFVLAGCFGDVAHDNPFDPSSDSYAPAGAVAGLVTDRAFQALSSVDVQIEESGFKSTYRASTNQTGGYQFPSVPPGEYTLVASKNGFAVLQDSISVDGFQTLNKDIMLNGAPLFEQVNIRSAHISRVWPPPTDFTLLEIMTRITDSDGVIDLEKAWLEIPGLAISDTLMFTEEPGVFRKDLGVADLGLTNMQDMLGESVMLKARDRLGYTSTTPELKIARIITETPVALSPQAGSVLSETQPFLTWVCQEIPYSFNYRVEVVRVDDVVRNTVTVISNLNPDTVCMGEEGSSQQEGRIQVDLSLNIGSYFWTVAIVDDFGNWSRSKEAGFVIN